MQVTVKQGHNLAQLCKGTINAGLICAVTLNGTTVSTMPQKGADPEWEDKAFSFQVSERPFPLTCAVALVHGKQAEKVAEGQVLLTAGALSASRKATLWVPLAQAQDKQVQSPAHANAHRSLHGNHPQYLDASSNFASLGSEDSFEQSGPGVYIEVRHDDHGHEQEEEMSSCGKPSAQARAPSEQPVAEHEGDVLQGQGASDGDIIPQMAHVPSAHEPVASDDMLQRASERERDVQQQMADAAWVVHELVASDELDGAAQDAWHADDETLLRAELCSDSGVSSGLHLDLSPASTVGDSNPRNDLEHARYAHRPSEDHKQAAFSPPEIARDAKHENHDATLQRGSRERLRGQRGQTRRPREAGQDASGHSMCPSDTSDNSKSRQRRVITRIEQLLALDAETQGQANAKQNSDAQTYDLSQQRTLSLGRRASSPSPCLSSVSSTVIVHGTARGKLHCNAPALPLACYIVLLFAPAL